jgi:hypothetical protein
MKLSIAKIFGMVFALTAFASYASERSSGPPGAEQTIQRLPDWMKPLYGHGLLATVDSGGEVASVIASRIVNDELLAKLKTLPKLRELHIEVTKDITPAGLALLAEIRTLEKLSLYQVNAEGAGLGDVAIRSAAGLPALRDLSVNECGTTDAGAKLLERLPQLTALSLRQEGRLTDEALNSIGKLPRLKSLLLASYVATERLGRMRFSADGIRHLSGLTNVETLSLVGQDVPADALNWPHLTSLALGSPSVDDAAAARIGTLHELRQLELSYCGIGDKGMQYIAALPELLRLNISSGFITDAGIETLRSHARLESVSLRASHVSDDSLRHLAGISTLTRLTLYGSGQPGLSPGRNFTLEGLLALKALPRLETLHLHNLYLPGGGYTRLNELTQLRALSLLMCNIKDEEFDALKEAMPKTAVTSSGGGMGRSGFQMSPRNRSNATNFLVTPQR